MLRFDSVGETRVVIDGGDAQALQEGASLLAACTLPLVIHNHARAAVLGTATLIRSGQRVLLVTAAHLFDNGARPGNLLAPLADGHAMVSLAGATVLRSRDADIACLDLGGTAACAALLRGRESIPAVRAWPRRRARSHARQSTRALVSGYPAAMTRFEEGWLAARRFTVFTRQRRDRAPQPNCFYEFGRVAHRDDGMPIHTPELEGMSGAGIWMCEPGAPRLHLVAVQSAYVHGCYLRGHGIEALGALFDA